MNGETESRWRSEVGVPEELIDRVCEDFETAWQSDHGTRIESFVHHLPELALEAGLRDLIALEVYLRRKSDEQIEAAEYHRRFREHASVVEMAFALLDADTSQDRSSDTDSAAKANGLGGGSSLGAAKAICYEVSPPKRIGRFEIRRVLGSGGFGVVYLAHDPQLDRLVALKVPHAERLARLSDKEAFLQEARTAARLNHSALVTVHDVCEADDLIYIVQEFVHGENLAAWAAAGPRSWVEIIRVLIEITEALEYLHSKGLWHRDLKPANVLVDVEGHAHLTDFGLAIQEDAQALLKGQVAGTPAYMSPEQTRGETHWIDGRTDIWSLGVILYELLCCERPFRATRVRELFAEIQERDPKSPRMRNPAVPKELERICFKCLTKQRLGRYSAASELLEDLRAFLATSSDSERSAANTFAKGTDIVRDAVPRESKPLPTVCEGASQELGRTVLKYLAKREGDRNATVNHPAINLRRLLDCALVKCGRVWLGLASLGLIAAIAWVGINARRDDASGQSATSPREPSMPWPERVRIESVEVQQLVRNARGIHQRMGVVLRDRYQLREGDAVQFRAVLSRPAYCYWIAFRPDGVQELCFPEDPNQPPPLTEEPKYPSEDPDHVVYGLTDGVGIQVFAIVASGEPLPPYRVWCEQRGSCPWRPTGDATSSAIRVHSTDRVQEFPLDPMQQTRGAGQRIHGESSVLQELVTWLAIGSPSVAWEIWALPVRPREESDGENADH